MRSRSWLLALPLLTVLSAGLGALSESFEPGPTPPVQAEPEATPKASPPPPRDEDEREPTVAVGEQNAAFTRS